MRNRIMSADKPGYFAELDANSDCTTSDNPDWWTSRLVQKTLQQQVEGQ